MLLVRCRQRSKLKGGLWSSVEGPQRSQTRAGVPDTYERGTKWRFSSRKWFTVRTVYQEWEMNSLKYFRLFKGFQYDHIDMYICTFSIRSTILIDWNKTKAYPAIWKKSWNCNQTIWTGSWINQVRTGNGYWTTQLFGMGTGPLPYLEWVMDHSPIQNG